MNLPLELPTGAAADVVTFGENSLDFVGVTAGPMAPADKVALRSFETRSGGQAATAAVACARQGVRTRYVGVFGQDDNGARVRAALATEHVDVCAVERPGAGSRVAIVLVDSETGERTIFEHRDAGLTLGTGDLPRDLLLSGRVLLVDATDLAAGTAAARAARHAGIPTMVDVDRVEAGTADLLASIDVIVVPAQFLLAFTGEASPGKALGKLSDRFRPAAAIVTLGGEGSLALCAGREVPSPGFPVRAVDTTGAGDAFRGGLLSAWTKLGHGADLSLLLAYAHATAALNCLHPGAQTGLPAWAEVQALVTGRGTGLSKN